MRLTGVDPDNPLNAVVPILDRSRQRYGRVISPNLVMAHRPEILVAASGLGQAIDESKLIEPRLKLMACVRAAQMIGCPFWVDINSAVGRDAGISDQQLEELAGFETSTRFDAREKAVLRYAEGMSTTPADVAETLFEQLRSLFNTEQIVELTAAIALENFRARFNCALKIQSDSLCMLPADHPVRQALNRP